MVHLLVSLLFVIFQAAPAPQAPAAPTNNPSYVVGPTDVLGIKVFDEPALSSNYQVDSDGSITFALIGRVMVGGKTVREVEAILTKALAGDYLRRPQVSVEIAQYRSRSIYVLGEVRTPGKYSIEDQVTLLEVIAKAGSLTNAAGNTITVRRQKDSNAPVTGPVPPGSDAGVEIMRINYDDLKEGRFNANITLQDGDTLFVPQAERFYVTGFVKTPGVFNLVPNMSVQQAIAQAGGLTERGSSRGIKILRKGKDGKDVEIEAKLTDLVQPNDTIIIRQRLI
jgi:polysaccharide export outer membrane protein